LEYIKPGKDLPKITIDQSKIGEVITNLVNNAIKFTDKGGVTVKAKDEGENVTVSVKDSGIGIDTNDQKHLFNKFYQAGRFDPNNPQEQQGTGLGLYISKNIIELHGGKIGLESEKDKGSTFYFSLPKEYNGSKAENGKLHCDESAVRVL
jgi:signal transduction histidine kinase